MTTATIAAFGVTLTRDGNTIAEITNLGSPEVTLETVDGTSHQSTSNFREYVGTVLDGGEVPIEGNFKAGDTNGQIGLQSDQLNRTVQTFVLTFPTAITATWTFTALVTRFKAGEFPIDGKVPFSATLKVTGKPTLALTAATGPTDIVVTGNIAGALAEVPTYAVGTYSYIVNTSADASVTVTVTAAGADTITVNGNTVASGVASSAVDLTPGAITTITVVVGETGKVSKTYVIRCMGAGA